MASRRKKSSSSSRRRKDSSPAPPKARSVGTESVKSPVSTSLSKTSECTSRLQTLEQDEPTEFERVAAKAKPAPTRMRRNTQCSILIITKNKEASGPKDAVEVRKETAAKKSEGSSKRTRISRTPSSRSPASRTSEKLRKLMRTRKTLRTRVATEASSTSPSVVRKEGELKISTITLKTNDAPSTPPSRSPTPRMPELRKDVQMKKTEITCKAHDIQPALSPLSATPSEPLPLSSTSPTPEVQKQVEVKKTESNSRTIDTSPTPPTVSPSAATASPSVSPQPRAPSVSNSGKVIRETKKVEEPERAPVVVKKSQNNETVSSNLPEAAQTVPTRAKQPEKAISYNDLYIEEIDLSSPGAAYLAFSQKNTRKDDATCADETKSVEHTAEDDDAKSRYVLSDEGISDAQKHKSMYICDLPADPAEVTAEETADQIGIASANSSAAPSKLLPSYSREAADRSPNFECDRSPNFEAIAAALHLVDYSVEKNLFADFLDAHEMVSINDYFKGHQSVDEHILAIFDKAFDKMLSSETLAKNEETKNDLVVLNKDRADSKIHLLDALIARKASTPASLSPSSGLRDNKPPENKESKADDEYFK
ncbi:hypothetical protein QR680_009896 [Steinernema hermaphroditum]|uniref:Uncharacterized protein n=1 Tax=Steinernema hermaphroditum TaxID=289476 RepID=A0AA39INA1_9BILA|nr:hypothetical protein QR680_009896 [Steinernema hermaphroditum]